MTSRRESSVIANVTKESRGRNKNPLSSIDPSKDYGGAFLENVLWAVQTPGEEIVKQRGRGSAVCDRNTVVGRQPIFGEKPFQSDINTEQERVRPLAGWSESQEKRTAWLRPTGVERADWVRKTEKLG